MKSLSLNKQIFLFFILFIFSSDLISDESVDIWKKENLNKNNGPAKIEKIASKKKKETRIDINAKVPKINLISSSNLTILEDSIFGIYEPNENNLTLDMWSNSEGTRIKDTIERINKIQLSSFAEKVFENTLFTISRLPEQNMTDEEFTNYKIDWLIKNKKDGLISTFLNKNKNFPNKSKIVKYLVDKNISKANLNDACEKIDLIGTDVKESYLDQFKIICLIGKNKKNEALLLIEILREQELSNKFFDNKINYLLGVSSKEDKKIDDTNLLNFYLSSIAISDFNYIPNKKTDVKIWQYLVNANLINIDNFKDQNQIKELEIAANNNSVAKSYVLEVYKNIKFDFNDLLNIDQVYTNLDPINARALIYQKTLLSENTETKLKYLFLLKDLFKKDNLSNVFREYLSQELSILEFEKIPTEYQQLATENIIYKKEETLGKIKYNDKTYHTSKVIKHFVEKNISIKITDKELKNIHKKLKKNKKYQISLMDVTLLESLKKDNFLIPKEIELEEILKNNPPPAELSNLVKNNEIGLFLLRIVELIGEDELLDLDSQTVYFINHLFIEAGLTKLRDKILITVLPDRTKI